MIFCFSPRKFRETRPRKEDDDTRSFDDLSDCIGEECPFIKVMTGGGINVDYNDANCERRLG